MDPGWGEGGGGGGGDQGVSSNFFWIGPLQPCNVTSQYLRTFSLYGYPVAPAGIDGHLGKTDDVSVYLHNIVCVCVCNMLCVSKANHK